MWSFTKVNNADMKYTMMHKDGHTIEVCVPKDLHDKRHIKIYIDGHTAAHEEILQNKLDNKQREFFYTVTIIVMSILEIATVAALLWHRK